jgi:uncharacterized membrane-anchored protein
MRIRQLVYRAISIDRTIYWTGTLALAIAVAIAAFFNANGNAFQIIALVALAWAALPIVLGLLRFVYSFFIDSFAGVWYNYNVYRHSST